jgi:hypothetical protein
MTNYTIYRLFDYDTGSYIGPEISNPTDFFNYHLIENNTFGLSESNLRWGMMPFLKPVYRWKLEKYWNRSACDVLEVRPSKPGMFNNRYAIKNEYGQNYEQPDELYRSTRPVRKTYWGRYTINCDEWNIRPPKNNINRMKAERWSWHYRSVKTMNETRQNSAHRSEYGPGLVRPSRGGRNLPNEWDDLPNSRWQTRKSWKHNSKRRHQWKK